MLKQEKWKLRPHWTTCDFHDAAAARGLLTAVLLYAVSIFPAAGQTAGQPSKEKPPEEAPSISVQVNLVNILCAVRNRRGGLISNLSKDDFEVTEDGKPQTIKYFSRETDLPLTIGLLVDVSASEENLTDIEKRAASAFFAKVLRKKDEAFLISFGSEAELLQDYTGSPRLPQDGLEGAAVEFRSRRTAPRTPTDNLSAAGNGAL